MTDEDTERTIDAAVAIRNLIDDADLDFGYRYEGVPEYDAQWWAQLRHHGDILIVEAAPSLVSALDQLAHKVLDRAACPHCQSPDCEWTRDHETWRPGCDRRNERQRASRFTLLA